MYERGKVWTYTMLFETRPTLFFKFKSMLISNPLIYLIKMQPLLPTFNLFCYTDNRLI
jgi:hypothetical protein